MINRDEHQHVAAGVLWARHSLIPYRDYPWFHTPYLPFIYGWMFRLVDHPLLIARGFSVLCASLTAGLLFAVAWESLADGSRKPRLLLAISAVLLFVSPPIFTYGLGRAWNQEPSVLLAFIAVLLVANRSDSKQSLWHGLGGGFALGIGIGLRITVAPLIAPLGGAMLTNVEVEEQKRRWWTAGAFSIGLSVALLPVLILCLCAPQSAHFGLIDFPRVNLDYLRLVRNSAGVGFIERLRYVVTEIFPRMAVILILLAGTLLFSLRHKLKAGCRKLGLVFIILPFLLMGSLAPTPCYIQYFYVEEPFLILGLIYGISKWRGDARIIDRLVTGIFLVTVLSLLFTYRPYTRGSRVLFQTSRWEAVAVHRTGQDLKALVGQGRILTLDPIFPLEGGLDIYPAFTSGVFAWRVGPFVPPTTRQEIGLVAPADLASVLDREPPGAILLGNEHHYEEFLQSYVRGHGYRLTMLQNVPNALQVWLPPIKMKP